MILEKVTGCTCDSLTVDGVREIDLDDFAREMTLKKISEFFWNYNLSKFGKLINEYLQLYIAEDDLEYIDEFYQQLIDEKVIKPLEQNITDIDVLIQLRSKLSIYINRLDNGELNWLLQEVVGTLGEYEYLGYCEQCCDSIYKYTLEI